MFYDDDDPRVGVQSQDLPRGLNPIQPFHLDVHQHEIRMPRLIDNHRLITIAALVNIVSQRPDHGM